MLISTVAHRVTQMTALFVAAHLCLPQGAFAQRGERYLLQEAPVRTPLSGYPGMFDAYLADSGSVVAEVPSLTVDYGFNENLTLGVNAFMAVPVLLGLPAVMLKARYRFFSTKDMASVFTTYGGIVSNLPGAKTESLRIGYLIFSNNTSFYLSERKVVNAFLFTAFEKASSGSQGSLSFKEASGSQVFAGASYQQFLSPWLGPQVLLLATLGSTQSIESSSMAASVSNGSANLSGTVFMARALADLRLGKSWLLSPGGVVLWSPGSKSDPTTSPFISAAVRW